MLTAGVKTAADFDAEILHCLIELQALLAQSISQFPRQTAGRRDSQFAGIRSWTRRDVHNSCCIRRAETDGFDRAVELRQIRLANPAKEDVLFHRDAYRFLDKT